MPGNDRRDEMRIALRAKISQKDYVDKEMKNFHYGKNSATIVNGQIVGGNNNGATMPASAAHL